MSHVATALSRKRNDDLARGDRTDHEIRKSPMVRYNDDHVHPACHVDEMTDGESRVIVVGDLRIGLFRVDGDFYALEDTCPHAGASLARGVLEGNVIRCRIHHWGFCLRDGTYLDEQKPEWNARSFPVQVVDGQVLIELRDVAD